MVVKLLPLKELLPECSIDLTEWFTDSALEICMWLSLDDFHACWIRAILVWHACASLSKSTLTRSSKNSAGFI